MFLISQNNIDGKIIQTTKQVGKIIEKNKNINIARNREKGNK